MLTKADTRIDYYLCSWQRCDQVFFHGRSIFSRPQKMQGWILYGPLKSLSFNLVSSSSSSFHTTSTDLPDPPLPPISIVHCSQDVFKATSFIGIELLYIGSSWSSYICLSIWRGLQEYIAYEFVLTSPAVSRMSDLSNLDGFCNGWLVAIQLLFSGVLPIGHVRYSSQHSCVIAVKLFLHTFS